MPTLIKVLGLCFVIVFSVYAEDSTPANFPRTVHLAGGEFVIYQPQPEKLDGDLLTARAAISYLPTGQTDAIFGAAWLAIALNCDRDERVATVRHAKITELRFPKESNLDANAIKDTFNAANITSSKMAFSLDLLAAALKAEADNAPELKHNPPKIFVREHPAVLVIIDGEPHFAPLANSSVMSIVNSPYSIFLDSQTKHYYLGGGDKWFSTNDLNGKWNLTEKIPADILIAANNAVVMPEEKMANAPEIIVSTEPAELLCTDGKPAFKKSVDTDLMYIANSENDIFYEPATKNYFVLLSGRWFKNSAIKESDWQYVAPEKMPPTFAKIPTDSDASGVLASVAGTPAAEEAMMDAQIPQTNKIMLNETPTTQKLDVVYDGEPRFEVVKETQLQYALNSSQPVLLYANNYYCCADGMWYVSRHYGGAWEICRVVPAEIYRLPPSNPYYHTRYVYVYECTPTYIVVGYTPGYLGSFYYGGVVVWGTGYYYRPWYERYYYPRPTTFGFRVAYNPFTGNWAFAAGWRSPYSGGGFFAVNFNRDFYRYGGDYFGPGRYRDVNVNFNRNTTINNITVNNFNGTNVYRRRETGLTRTTDINPQLSTLSSRDSRRVSTNDRSIDDRRATVVESDRTSSIGDRRSTTTTTSSIISPTTSRSEHTRGDVVVDREGNVFRRDNNNQWQENRDGRKWEKTTTERVTTRSANPTPQPTQRDNTRRENPVATPTVRPNVTQEQRNPQRQNSPMQQPMQRNNGGVMRHDSAADAMRTRERAQQRTQDFQSSRPQERAQPRPQQHSPTPSPENHTPTPSSETRGGGGRERKR